MSEPSSFAAESSAAAGSARQRGGADWRPTATWDVLRLRAELLARLRAFFTQRGFLEVETPTLSADIVVDRHLDPFETRGGSAQAARLFLQTSPEFAMKRLLAAGGEAALVQITRAYRQAEQGPRHNPEFTIVEWYRTGDDYQAGMQLLDDVAQCLFGRGAAERITYRDAFLAHAGIDPWTASTESLYEAGRALGLIPPESLELDQRDAWLDWLLTERVEPRLGRTQPTILCDYPATQAALARVRSENPPVAERFELYVDGIELANGYHELLDAAVLRERQRTNNAQRRLDGKGELPEQSRLLDAMEHGLPPCSGVALGFDRAVMILAGVSTIQEVLAFPFERA